MKVPIIYVKENNDKIEMSKEEFENIIDKIYEAGYKDGEAAQPLYVPTSTPKIDPNP